MTTRFVPSRALSMAVVAAATLVGSIAPSTGITFAEAPYPIVFVDHGVEPGFVLDISSSGMYGVVNDGGGSSHTVFSAPSGDAEPLDMGTNIGAIVSDDGTAYAILTDGVITFEALGGSPTDVTIESLPDWFMSDLIDIDPTGSFALVRGSNGNIGRVRTFLVDLGDGSLVTDTDDGLTSGGGNSTNGWFSADGTTVTIEQNLLTGQVGPTNYVTVDLATSARTTIQEPTESEPSKAWFVDRSLQTVWFWSDNGGIVAGVAAGPLRLYRRDLSTGDTVAAPLALADSTSGVPLGADALVYLADVPTAGGLGAQLYLWDGLSAEVEQLTVGLNDAEPDGSIKEFWVSDQNNLISFVSFATNLTPGITDPSAGHLFQIDLTPILGPVDPTEPAAPVAASQTYCVPAIGAAPGDFVGVNITPVNATTNGNGSLHSSDDDPPSTANVNFRLGSVDPNVAFAQVGADFGVCFTNSKQGPVDVVMDELIVADGAAFALPSADGAVRIADTRSGLGGTTVPASTTRCVAAEGDPGDIAGVNITPVNAVTNGNGALHSSDDDPPSTANVNFAAGSVDPNLAFASIGTDGKVCFTNSKHGPVDVIMDQLIVGDGSVFADPTASGAVRLVDTRTNLGAKRFAASQTQCVAAVGADPGDWVGVNATPVNAVTNGNGALHSSDDDPPSTANVNFRLGSVDPNFAIVQVGADGKICFTNSKHGPVDLILDELIVGAATAFAAPTDTGAYRLTDTRVARY